MKKHVLFLFTFIWAVSTFSQTTQTINGIRYSLDATTRTATVMSNNSSYSGNFIIPETIIYNSQTYTITAIGNYAFSGCSLITISIPSTVTQIGQYAFRGSSLLSITIPNGVTRIEESTFDQCYSLASVSLPEGLIYIGKKAFYKCTSLTSITIPSTISSMGDNAFMSCGLTHIVWHAKHCADFTGSNAPFLNESSSSLNINGMTRSIEFGSDVEYIPAYLCYYFLNISTIDIPDNVIEIGDYAFYATRVFSSNNLYDTNLTSITFGNRLTSIGTSAFQGRNGLTSIEIPNNVTTLGAGAFRQCSNIHSITLGNSITTIGAHAFGGTSVNTLNIYAVTPPTIIDNVFSGYSNLMSIDLNVRSTALTAYQNANVWGSMHVQAMANDLRSYTLTVTSANESQGVTTLGGTYDENSEILIYAHAKSGYQFLQWNDSVTDNPRTVTMINNLTYTAHFVSATPVYSLTISANASQGSVIGGGSYHTGEIATIAAIPNNGYSFSQWSDGNMDNPRLVTITGDAIMMALFNADAVKYTITASTTNAAQGVTVGSGLYETGSVATIAALANSGYHFTQWNDGVKTNPRSIQVTNNATYIANFEADAPWYVITVMSTNNSQGIAYGDGSYESGATALLVAVPNNGYHFSQWNDGVQANPRTVQVTRNATYIANFEADAPRYEITVVSTNNSQGVAYGDGSYESGATALLVAVPNDGYHFSQWNDGNTENPRVVTVSGNITYLANFEQDAPAPIVYTLDIAPENASIGWTTEGCQYDGGELVMIYAQATEGYQFLQWSDGNTDNPRFITITSDMSLIAQFEVSHSTTISNVSRTSSLKVIGNSLQNPERQELSVYQTDGRLVYFGASNEISLPDVGVYLVKLDSEVLKITVK